MAEELQNANPLVETPLLQLKNVSVNYGKFRALTDPVEEHS